MERVFFRDFGNDYDCVSPRHFLLYGAKGFPKKSFNAISLHAFSVFFSYGNPHRHFWRRSVKYGQRGGESSFPLIEKSLKIRLFFQSIILHKQTPFKKISFLCQTSRASALRVRPYIKNGKSSPFEKRKGIRHFILYFLIKRFFLRTMD